MIQIKELKTSDGVTEVYEMRIGGTGASFTKDVLAIVETLTKDMPKMVKRVLAFTLPLTLLNDSDESDESEEEEESNDTL